MHNALLFQQNLITLTTLSVFGVGQFGRVVSEGRVKYPARAHFLLSNRRLKQCRRGDVMESWSVDCGKGAISVDCKGLQKEERDDFEGVVTPSWGPRVEYRGPKFWGILFGALWGVWVSETKSPVQDQILITKPQKCDNSGQYIRNWCRLRSAS